MRFIPGLLLSAALLTAAPLAFAEERTAFELQAREIYQTVVESRSAKGQGNVPVVVDYIVRELKAGGFAAADIDVTDYEIEGELVQGLMVWYRAEGTPKQKPIAPSRTASPPSIRRAASTADRRRVRSAARSSTHGVISFEFSSGDAPRRPLP